MLCDIQDVAFLYHVYSDPSAVVGTLSSVYGNCTLPTRQNNIDFVLLVYHLSEC